MTWCVYYRLTTTVLKMQECRDARDAKRDIQVPLSPSPVTTSSFSRGRPAVAAALHYAERHSAHNDWTACRMRLHMASAGYGTSFLRHSGHTLAPYASRGLPASAFGLPWQAANVVEREMPEQGWKAHGCC